MVHLDTFFHSPNFSCSPSDSPALLVSGVLSHRELIVGFLRHKLFGLIRLSLTNNVSCRGRRYDPAGSAGSLGLKKLPKMPTVKPGHGGRLHRIENKFY